MEQTSVYIVTLPKEELGQRWTQVGSHEQLSQAETKSLGARPSAPSIPTPDVTK